MQAVPTAVTLGPDGALYVGQLTASRSRSVPQTYRVPANGGTPRVYASGFTNIIGIAFDPSGTPYVLQIGNGLGQPLAPPGKSSIRVNSDGSQTVIYDQLFSPGRSRDPGPDGAAYVTNFGIVPGPIPGAFPDGGTVLRITLD